MLLNIRKLGLAWALTPSLLYLGCVYIMAVLGKKGTMLFFNSLMHGIDISPILRMEMSLPEMAMGLASIFIIGWLVGATIACIYNLSVLKGIK